MNTRTNQMPLLDRPVEPQQAQQVLPHHTHKRRPAARLVDRWRRQAADRFQVTACWRGASLEHYQSAGEEAPSLPLVAETLRQATIAMCHAAYGVPLDQSFVMNTLSVEVEGSLPDLDTVRQVEIDLTCHNVTVRNETLRSLDVALEFRHEGRLFARGGGALILLSPSSYRRVRGDRDPVTHRTPGPRVSFAAAGRRHREDVLLAVSPRGLHLAVDTQHPWYFDHAVDHLPGMVLIEAAVQSFHLSSDRRPTALHATFDTYTEVASQVTVMTTPSDDSVGVEFHQDGSQVASVVVVAR